MNYGLILLSLLLSDGSGLEAAGDLTGAGRAYFEEGDLAGEVRILSRFIEESLYSGNSIHAFDLIRQMENIDLKDGCIDFWYARLAWSCGLSEYSCAALESVTGSPWLETRSAGLASLFRGDGENAVRDLALSMQLAESVRQRYYSALDLCFALMSSGRFQEAEDIAVHLAENFPGEGLPLTALALCMQGQGRFGQAMSVLQSIYTSTEYSYISRDMARSLMEDLE
jgi:tetratricopeptide (TPR) repeat protein